VFQCAVVEALDELEHGHAGFGLRLEPSSIEKLALERGEEALRHRVVVGIAHRAHRGPHPGLTATLAEGDGGILRALVRVMDDILRSARCQRHVQGIEHKLGVQGRCHRPADDAPAKRIECDRQIEKAGPRRNVGDVGHPQQVRALGGEVALNQVGRLPRPLANRRGDEPAAADAGKTGPAHQTRDALLADVDAIGLELGMDAGRPIDASRGRMDRANALDQHCIVLAAPRQRPLRPRVIPAGGDAQHAALRGHRVDGPVLAHELEPLDGIAFVSRANQAAAFDRISRSTLS
jgi:hypothetical protein